MEINIHKYTVAICVSCSDAIIIRYPDMEMATNDYSHMYMVRITTCFSCAQKIKYANLKRRSEMQITSSTELCSEDYMEVSDDPIADMKMLDDMPMSSKAVTGYNAVVGLLMVTNMPMYKRLMAYLKGNVFMKTLNGQCVIESVNKIVPMDMDSCEVTSVYVSTNMDTKLNTCGCLTSYMKEMVTEVPYESGTFLGFSYW
jgi:hypothetical protein